MLRSVRMGALNGAVRALYCTSFSEIEKIPEENLLRALSGGAELVAYHDDNRFIGFTFSFIDRDMMFLVYFATEPEVRGRGYGAEILDILRKEHPDHRIFLVTETCEEGSPDYDICSRRQAFYRRNGCRDTSVRVLSDDWWFDTMFVQGTLSEEEMVATVRLYEDVHNGREPSADRN